MPTEEEDRMACLVALLILAVSVIGIMLIGHWIWVLIFG
jgi:hypothetical protein